MPRQASGRTGFSSGRTSRGTLNDATMQQIEAAQLDQEHRHQQSGNPARPDQRQQLDHHVGADQEQPRQLDAARSSTSTPMPASSSITTSVPASSTRNSPGRSAAAQALDRPAAGVALPRC